MSVQADEAGSVNYEEAPVVIQEGNLEQASDIERNINGSEVTDGGQSGSDPQ